MSAENVKALTKKPSVESVVCERLSVIVLTYNEKGTLPPCLASLENLDCEIFVVDSGSSDQTVEIAEKAGARVIQHPFDNYAAQRNWAMENLPIRSEWVLNLDADERLTPPLVSEINQLLGDPPDEVNGYLLRKRTIFMGKWIKHGGHYPAYHLRLFRTGQGVCEDRLYDQHFLVDGKVERLRHDYIDVLTSDLAEWTVRHARWAELEAREIMMNHLNGSRRVQSSRKGNPIERRRWLREKVYLQSPLFVRAFIYWLYRYFIRLGFLDGKEGLIFHFLQGFWFRFLIDAKVHENRGKSSANSAEH